VILPILPSAKLALWQAMREHGLNNVTLARMLDLDHQTKIGTLENALRVLGRQMTCEVRQAA
jgi:hypothetical protein